MALSTFTFKKFEAQVRAETGASDYANPNSTTIMRWTNIALKKIARLTHPVDAPWGRDTHGLSRLSDNGYLHSPGDGGDFVAATKIFSSLSGLNQTFVGGIVFFIDQFNSRGHWGLIDEVNAAGTTMTVRVTGGTGALADISSANLFFMAKMNPWFYEGANLRADGDNVIYNEIIKVVDATNGLAARLDGDAFSMFSSNPNYDNSVVWQYAGDSVYLGKGSSISSYGTLSAVFDGKPDTITASTDALDIKPEHISVLKDEVVRWVLNYMENTEKVKAIGNPLESLEVKYRQTASERAVQKLKADSRLRRV